LERELPDLCADRIDYALRDRAAYHGDHVMVKSYLDSFVVKDDEIIFNDQNVAKKFAEDFLDTDYKYWSHPREVALFQVLADAIKIALEKKIISQDDLFEDDSFVFDKLKNSQDKDVLEHLNKLNPKFEIKLDDKDYDFYSRNKLRFVNPKFVSEDSSIKRVTDVFPEFEETLEEHKDWIESGNYIKIVAY